MRTPISSGEDFINYPALVANLTLQRQNAYAELANWKRKLQDATMTMCQHDAMLLWAFGLLLEYPAQDAEDRVSLEQAYDESVLRD